MIFIVKITMQVLECSSDYNYTDSFGRFVYVKASVWALTETLIKSVVYRLNIPSFE